MGKDRRKSSTAKDKRNSRLSVLDRINELDEIENSLRDASDIDVRRRESIADFQIDNIENLKKETRGYWIIGKQIEINKEIEQKFRTVDKESVVLNEKLLKFMDQLQEKVKTTNMLKTHLLEAQYQNLELLENKMRQKMENTREYSEDQVEDLRSAIAADAQVEEAITGMGSFLKRNL
ncbi:Oidioi.mRNA.OKI2018_I69.PAR.g10284.t1.cds [Oikopleura dioica]|uniref:Oidioi.mRNA.OKI2018_I69.PAR.g10284.t1.cds n=1 Tax=Oikopleura dioica TaxID=34765 RepID=A0ABN7RPY0_OIKDI|nr:Oidioi.mRNA.OKI2018_I69.PAR.g10284.t1.cds [Oikopleura dioica]